MFWGTLPELTKIEKNTARGGGEEETAYKTEFPNMF